MRCSAITLNFKTSRQVHFLVLLALVAATAAMADVEIPMTELLGDYSIGGENSGIPPASRQMMFTFPAEIESLEGLHFLADGPWTMGDFRRCRTLPDGSVYCDTLPRGIPMTLVLTSEAAAGCEFRTTFGAYNSVEGDDPLTGSCEEGEPDFNSLLGVWVHAELFCDVSAEDIPNYVTAAHGTVSSATLVVTGETPVTESRWGAVKSLYR